MSITFTAIPARCDGTTVRPVTPGQEVTLFATAERPEQTAWVAVILGDTFILRCSDGARRTVTRRAFA